MDISIILSDKNKVGAKRIVIDEGWPIEKVREATPSRVGMNNRTTVLGEFTKELTAKWTVTDAVSTGDKDVSLPLENRTLGGNQTQNGTQTAVYGLDNEGKMSKIADAPTGNQPVGTIAVYEYTGSIDATKKDPQTLGGVSISRYQDVIVDQNWNLPNGQTMPEQIITVTDKDGNKTQTKVDESPAVQEDGDKQRLIVVPDIKYWDIDDNGKATFRDHTVSQDFPEGKVTIVGKEYKYSENANYFRPDTRVHYIQNSLDESTDKKPATFTVIKVDSKDPKKRVQGASFDLLGANVSVITDANGEATFRNIKPGRYYLTETKAPDGYKIDQNQKTIEISDDGQIRVYGQNAKLSAGSGKTAIVEHSDYPNWPDFMNTMHYGKLDANGNLEFYVYLKPYAPRLGGKTDKDTRFNISIPGVDANNIQVTVHDINPVNRDYYTYHMENQSMGTATIFENVIGKDNNNGKITGAQITADQYTGKPGYSIFFPQARFGDDWGFLVKVNANVGTDNNPVTISYDWLADKDTATNSKIQEAVTVSTNPDDNGHPTITITNEEFKKSPIEVAKFADSLDDEGNRVKLPGAQFVLKDANGKPITNAYTKDDGKVNFEEFPPGTYYLEEQTAPAGYEKSDVYFEVKVNEKGEVTYTAKFKTSSGTPVPGQDYFIDKGEATSPDAKAKVLDLYQHMDIKDSGRGRFPGVWEAYELESLKYELKAKLIIAGPGSRFEVQFDKNLDFTQYFTEFPDLYDDGKVIAKPYFDRNTNLLTYVFTENAKKGETTIGFNLFGMIPNKFFAKTHGKYQITNVVQPGTSIPSNVGNQTETIDVQAYFGEYDARRDSRHRPLASPPTQAYYFRDVYQDNNGDWYVKAFAYYNPLGNYSGGAKNLRFNWMSTNYQQDKIQHEWNANGNLPAFQLENVKVYRTDKMLTNATYYNGNKDVIEEVSTVMPLSMGIRPEQDPITYRKVFDTNINPESFKSASSNNVYLEYNPREIKPYSTLQDDAPLKMTMPSISSAKEGYVIEQTFKIPDIKKFNEKWRAFYMGQNTVLRSTFITGPNRNYGSADQTGQEIPKFYKEIVGIINRKFTPGQFKITKTEDNTGNKLQGAVFALTDASGNTIYRSSDTNGLVEFKDLKPGRYTLVESQALEGHTGSKEKWEVIVSNDGSVRIEEISVTGSGNIYTGNNDEDNIINIPVTNRKIGEKFQVFKKDGDGQPLQGATFTITKQGYNTPTGTAISNEKGIVEFNNNLTEGTYIIEETKAPVGYKKLDQKWVLVIDKDGNKKVYNYSSRTKTDEKSLLGEEGTYIVNVKDRPQIGWESFDNRNTGWAGNSTNAEHLGTRIIAINKTQRYVVQRYVINPEAKNIDATTSATIHREKPNYPNMDWYNKDNSNADYKVFTLAPKQGGNTDGKVSGFISDLRLADYTLEDITENIKKTEIADSTSHYGETRLKLTMPKTDKPIVVDVKVPYKDENGGVGTGMDWRESGITYWKSDYYERVTEIVLGDSFASEIGSIEGSYIGEGSLDVINEAKTYGFKIQKVKEGDASTLIPGAKFKLTGPDEFIREMTTGADGMISFDGLKPGTYTLEETEPAPGYKKVDTKWTVRIANDGKAYIKVKQSATEGTESNASLSVVKLESINYNQAQVLRSMALRTIDFGVNPKLNPETATAQALDENLSLAINLPGKILEDFVNGKQTLNHENQIESIETDLNAEPMGLEIGDNLIGAPVQATPSEAYSISNTITNEKIRAIHVTTTAKDEGDDVYYLRIDMQNNTNSNQPIGYIPITFNRDFSFVGGSTRTWKTPDNGADQNGRWHIGYNNGQIDLRNGELTIAPGQTASIELRVKRQTNLNTNTAYNLINDIKFGTGSIKSPKVTKIKAYKIGYDANHGEITTNPYQYAKSKQRVTITSATPHEGYEVVGKPVVTTSSGNNVNVGTNNTFVMPEDDVTVRATFRAKTYNISYTNPNGGQVTGPTSAKTDEQVTVTTTPENGYKFDKLIVTDANGQSVSTDGNSFVMPAGNVRVSAQFKQDSYTIGYQSPQNGSVELPQTAKAGDTVTITARPDEGYMVDTITVNSGQGKVEVTGNTFVMPKLNVVVNVTFKLKPADKFNVRVSQTTNGSVSAEPTSQEAGKTVNLTVTPDQGYKLESLSVKDSSGNDVTVNNNSFTMPKSDVTINATFVEDTATTEEGPIKINPNIENGKITFSPPNPQPGDKVTITVTPEPGYELKDLIVKDSNGKPIEIEKISPLNENNRPSIALNRTDKLESQSFSVNSRAMFTSVDEESLGISEPKNFVSLASADQATNFGQVEKTENGLELSEEIVNDPVRAGESSVSQYTFIMPAGNVSMSASFASVTIEGETEIKPGEAAQITNKQTGLELNVFKVNNLNRKLQGAEFTIEKYKDNTYKEKDSTFPTDVKGTSDENGLVQFKDKEGNVVSLPTGHYLITETEAPQGYKKAQAPWKLEVYEENGQLKAKYSGPEDTANGLLTSDKALAKSNDSTDLQEKDGIKYKSRLTYINPETKTYVQRIYIDTRNYKSTDPNNKENIVNVQIVPEYKRDETDEPGVSPKTNIEGVKTAYRTTYKITGGVADNEIDNVLRYYDLSKPNVSMINTARWRPFDWGFDEDLLNLDKGVYFIDVEGFYDDAIITGYDSEQGKNTILEEDQGKLDLNIDFYDGERKFQQATGKDANGNIIWTDGTDFNDAYLLGNVNLGYVIKNEKGQDVPTDAGNVTPPGAKYPLWLGKTGGRIYPSLDKGTKTSISTRVDISSLYSSDSMKGVPQDGLTLTNEEETYNITFSKHGRDNPEDKINSEKVTNKRLEGAIFKLQQDNGITYEDVPGSFVASAFNGYFGFRGLKPGRYRLMEVQAPEGYKPINDPLLYFTVETITTNLGKIVHPVTGQEVDIKSIQVKFPGNDKVYNLSDLTMVDPKDEAGTKIASISGVDSKEIDIETALIIDPNDNTNKVPLKDLSIPGSNNKDYQIGDTRVVEGKSGYISLEYDKANGVYQYVPEKSTTVEEGKLIDFVTSATAKNMGKIINEKPGEGEVTIKKFDQDGNSLVASKLLPGAKFRLINLTNGEEKNGTIGEEGTLDFENLQIGNYRLVETKSPDGYENNNQIWNFTVGGEGLDPYSGEVERTGVDLSDKISLKTEKASVLNPDKKTSTEITTQNKEVHPHLGESIEFENKFKLKADTKINPGDYFILKMSEDIDLNGIFEYEIENLDIIAPGVGTIAKADYNRNARIITYTFTDYAKSYTLLEFSNKLTTFIDLYKVKSDANKNVGFRIAENDTSNYKNVKVVYDQDYGRQADHFGNTINITSKIVKYDPKTGEFLHYYYINKLKDFSYGPVEFRYDSDQRIDNLRIDVAKVYNNNWNYLNTTMPDSFAVNESSNNLYQFENKKAYQWLNKGYYAPVYFNDGIGRGDSYIVKVTGRVGNEDKSEYKGYGTLYKFNTGYTPTHAERHDSIRYFKNEATAEAKLEIQAVNPENKITFKKVDQNGKALAGAKFKLEYLAQNSTTWSGTDREPDENGVLTLTKLKPGKYKLTETSAPEGYKMAENPIMEFEVDSNGKITKKETSVDGKSTVDQDIGGTTNYVVNSKNYEIEFKKVDADDNTKALEGAEFEIWYKAQESDEYSNDKLKLYQNASGKKIVLKADETASEGYTEVKVFKTGADGLVKFSFTEQGYYAIKETKAPKGYIAPREYVKEFVVKDGKVQADRYKTEMDVSKTKGWYYANGLHDVYNTDITMRFNPDHEKITYEQGKSKITLSGLPLNNEYYENNIDTKKGITIDARLVNTSGKSKAESYTVPLSQYGTDSKGNITIDLYELVKKLEKKIGETADSITSEKTIELSMSSTLALKTTLDINSKIEIGEGEDAISEERTFNIGTKGDEKVDHSYSFTNLGEPELPIPVENRKAEYPLTGGKGTRMIILAGFVLMGLSILGKSRDLGPFKRRKKEVSDGE